jgi:hypothetical protein
MLNTTLPLDPSVEYKDSSLNSSFISLYEIQSPGISSTEKRKPFSYSLPSQVSPFRDSSLVVDTNDYSYIDEVCNLKSYFTTSASNILPRNHRSSFQTLKCSSTRIDGNIWRCLSPRAENELKYKRGICLRNGMIPHYRILARP